MNPLDWIKIGAGVALGASLMVLPAYLNGKSAGRAEIEAEAARNALERIETLENNNAKFKNGSDRDRCLIFMRDSGLPDEECD
jgi:hypothetical protein